MKKKAKLNFCKTQRFENSNTPRETWKTINKVIGKNSADNSIPIIQNTVPGASSLPHNQSVAQVLNQFFTSVGPSLARAILPTVTDTYLPPPQICSSMFITPICSEEILKLINLLDNKTSTDPYAIPVRLVKLSKNIVCTCLADIFNNCVQNGIFPDKLKFAKVIPNFKSDAKDIASNYRPISILSHFSKIFEKLMHKNLVSFLDTNNIITKHQLGFHSGLSTFLALNQIHNYILRLNDSGQYTCGIFLDLKKAFETVKSQNIARQT